MQTRTRHFHQVIRLCWMVLVLGLLSALAGPSVRCPRAGERTKGPEYFFPRLDLDYVSSAERDILYNGEPALRIACHSIPAEARKAPEWQCTEGNKEIELMRPCFLEVIPQKGWEFVPTPVSSFPPNGEPCGSPLPWVFRSGGRYIAVSLPRREPYCLRHKGNAGVGPTAMILPPRTEFSIVAGRASKDSAKGVRPANGGAQPWVDGVSMGFGLYILDCDESGPYMALIGNDNTIVPVPFPESIPVN